MILSLNISSNITEHLLHSDTVLATRKQMVVKSVTANMGGLKEVLKIKWGHEDGP